MTKLEELEARCEKLYDDCEYLRYRRSLWLEQGTDQYSLTAYHEARRELLHAQAELWAARKEEEVTA